MGDLIEFPDVKESREKISRLRNDLEALFLEREHLRSVICVNIQKEYTLVFGGLEYQIYKASCDYLRSRRKTELIQAKKNRLCTPAGQCGFLSPYGCGEASFRNDRGKGDAGQLAEDRHKDLPSRKLRRSRSSHNKKTSKKDPQRLDCLVQLLGVSTIMQSLFCLALRGLYYYAETE